jgi:hypothetical protein
VNVQTGGFRRDPTGAAISRGDAPVHRGGNLADDEWSSELPVDQILPVDTSRLLTPNANGNIDSRPPKGLDTSSVDSLIWILDSHNHPSNTRIDKRIDAR